MLAAPFPPGPPEEALGRQQGGALQGIALAQLFGKLQTFLEVWEEFFV